MDDDADVDDIWMEDHPHDDPLWQRAGEMVGAAPPPSRNYGVYSLAFLARVLPVLRASERLAVALLLYRQCLLQRSRIVDLSNGMLIKLGIGRMTKYRTLHLLEEA